MTGKIAIVLMNLGGPDRAESVKPFLFNFFMDKNIIGAPQPLRWMLAKWISKTRGNGAAKTNYAVLGGKSPLLENTQAQADALQAALQKDYPAARVFVSMRYWHPMADAVAQDVKNFAPDRVILLPLYPQFSTTTSFSSFENWDAAAKKAGLAVPAEKICCYPLDGGFIAASADRIATQIDAAAGRRVRILFSAHGLPQKTIDKGDPYQYQCERTAEAIVRALDIQGLDWQICYQSRVGPMRWIGPSTEEALQRAAADKTGVIVYPHAFVNEHVETLVEIGEEYRQFAAQKGVPYFARAETVATHPAFIGGLLSLVQKKISRESFPRFCPASYTRCGCAL